MEVKVFFLIYKCFLKTKIPTFRMCLFEHEHKYEQEQEQLGPALILCLYCLDTCVRQTEILIFKVDIMSLIMIVRK